MKFFVLPLLAAAVCAVPLDGDIPGIVTPAQWVGQAFLEGPGIQLNGTVQEVYAQFKELNPNYDYDLSIDAVETESALSKRTDFGSARTICNNFPSIGVGHLDDGIQYLRRIGGRPQLRPPSFGSGYVRRHCSGVSCSYSTAIWWCNDSKQTKTSNSFGSIAEGARRTWGVCAGRIDQSLSPGQVSGQAFHPTDWNVIVRKGSC
ncbi:hypothetical protein PWT90_05369 [Aphanocladium album]|nr:hypothetical protein PWT90_05369 [Aphanocladium album]